MQTNQLKGIRFILILVGTLVLSACGDGFQANKRRHHDGRTGATGETIDGITGDSVFLNYTGAGNRDELAELKRIYKESKTDHKLAKAIQKVTVTKSKFKNGDTKGTPGVLKVDITLQENNKKSEITFEGPIVQSGSELAVAEVAAKDSDKSEKYKVSIECKTANCDFSLIHLKEYGMAADGNGENGLVVDEAGVLYDTTLVKGLVQSARGETLGGNLKGLEDAFKDGKPAKKTNVIVAYGQAYTEVVQPAIGEGNEPPLKLVTRLFETNKGAKPKIGEISIDGIPDSDIEAKLTGNNTIKGDIAIDFKVRGGGEDKDEGRKYRVYFQNNDISKFTVYNGSIEDLYAQDSIIPLNTSDEKLVNTRRVVKGLENYRNHPEILRYIKYFQLKNYKKAPIEDKFVSCVDGNPRDLNFTANNFFARIKPLVPDLTNLFESIDVTADVSYLMFVESKFAIQKVVNDDTKTSNLDYRNAHYPIEVNQGKGTTASGPFQMTWTTSNGLLSSYSNFLTQVGLNLELHPLQYVNQEKVLHPDDFRNFLIPSALLAGLLARDNFKKFKEDPALFPTAHYLGEPDLKVWLICGSKYNSQEAVLSCYNKNRSGKKRKANFISSFGDFETSLDQVYRYNMELCDIMQFTFRVLALRFIGMNPLHYGFELPKAKDAPNVTPAIYHPEQGPEVYKKISPEYLDL